MLLSNDLLLTVCHYETEVQEVSNIIEKKHRVCHYGTGVPGRNPLG